MTRPEALCSILLGCWICDSLTGSLARRFRRDISSIATAFIRDGRRRPAADWSQTPATLKLIAASLFASHGIEIGFLHGEGGYVHQAQTLLRKLARVKASEAAPLYEKSALMHRMGHRPKPTAATLTDVLRFARVLSLADTETGREHLLGLLYSSTECGQRSVAFGAAGGWMKDLVFGFAMAALRNYDLITGCRWMRAARYLFITEGRLDACVEFLRLHQRPEGLFGYYPAEPEVTKLPGTGAPFYPGTSISLPVTVECLWTLAETTTPWRLFRNI